MQKCIHALAQPMDLCLVNYSIKTDGVEKFRALCVYTTSTATLQFCTLWHVGAPNVTGLTFDRESRTLTCTSTGGPATTVTWKKDGTVITPNKTYQQTKRLVDTVEGIYQNTLTIAQSVAERNIYDTRYNCMVENSRGKSNRTMYLYGKNIRIYVHGHENDLLANYGVGSTEA